MRPSLTRSASGASIGFRTHVKVAPSRSRITSSVVAPCMSRTARTAASSSLDEAAFAGVPRFLAARARSRFEPLAGLRIKVSSASTIPPHGLRFDVFSSRQKTLALAESSIEGNATALGRFPQAHTIDRGLSVGKPCIAAMELSQKRTSQCVEGLAAAFTAVACRAVLGTPAADRRRASVPAEWRRLERCVDQWGGLLDDR